MDDVHDDHRLGDEVVALERLEQDMIGKCCLYQHLPGLVGPSGAACHLNA